MEKENKKRKRKPKKKKTKIDFWNRHKIGTRFTYMAVLVAFVIMSYKVFIGETIQKRYIEMIEYLLTILIFGVSLGLNSVELIASTYFKRFKK